MTLEERVASALRTQTETLIPPPTDLLSIRSAARAQSRRRAAGVLASAVVVALVVVVSGITEIGRDRSDGLPGTSPSSSPTATEMPPIDTTSWTTYTSDRYDLQVGHPADWIEIPSSRKWESDADVSNHLSEAHESFLSPLGDVRVSVWAAPLATGTSIESSADIEAWVQAYCEASGNTPCTGIHDRAVQLCLEKRDCHPGLLVPFKDDTQAFFSAGIYDAEAMTVVAVWRGESDLPVARYGGAQRLLEAFLSTMEVWPASTPFEDRN